MKKKKKVQKKDVDLGEVLTQKRTIKQYTKFFIIGLSCMIVNLVILYTLTEFFGIYYIVSAILSGIITSSGNFVLNKTWTFKEEIESKFFAKYFKFYVVRIGVFLISISVLFVLTEFLHIYYLISQIIVFAVLGILTFLAQKLWTFEK